MKKLLIMVAIMRVACLFAAPITWEVPQDMAGDTDVRTDGQLIFARMLSDTTENQLINGVTFSKRAPYTGQGTYHDIQNGGGFTVGADTGIAALPTSGTFTANYRTALTNYFTGGANELTRRIDLSYLVPGHTYVVQLWAFRSNPSAISFRQKVEGYVGDPNAVTMYRYQTTTGLGQHLTGTFTADSSTQSFYVTPIKDGVSVDLALNMLQVRDITEKPTDGITWELLDNPTDSFSRNSIISNTDVRTQGKLISAFANTGITITNPDTGLNVPFRTMADLQNNSDPLRGILSFNWVNGYKTTFGSTAAPYINLPADYKLLVQSGQTLDGVSSMQPLTLCNLVPTRQYLVQYWVNDSRPYNRFIRLSDQYREVRLRYSTGTAGSVGQYAVGTFTAATSRKDLNLQMIYASSSGMQCNGIQVRELTSSLSFTGGVSWVSTGAEWGKTEADILWDNINGLTNHATIAIDKQAPITITGNLHAQTLEILKPTIIKATGSGNSLTVQSIYVAQNQILTFDGLLGGTEVIKAGGGVLEINPAYPSPKITVAEGTVRPISYIPTTNLQCQFDAADQAAVEVGFGGTVTTWRPKYAANSALQMTRAAGGIPLLGNLIYKTNVFSALPAMSFANVAILGSTVVTANRSVLIANKQSASSAGNSAVWGQNLPNSSSGRAIMVNGALVWRSAYLFTQKLYVDGLYQSADYNTSGYPNLLMAIDSSTQNWSFQMGAHYNTGRPWKGDVGEVLVYNVDLSAAENQSTKTFAENYLLNKWVVPNRSGIAKAVLGTTTNCTSLSDMHVELSSVGTFELDGRNATVTALAGSGNIRNAFWNDIVTLTVTNAESQTFGGLISGPLRLVKRGVGTLTLSSANTQNYEAETFVSDGTLALQGATGGLPTNTALIVNSGATFNAATATQTVRSVVCAGIITAASGLTVTDMVTVQNAVVLPGSVVTNGVPIIMTTQDSVQWVGDASFITPNQVSITNLAAVSSDVRYRIFTCTEGMMTYPENPASIISWGSVNQRLFKVLATPTSYEIVRLNGTMISFQ